MMRTMRGCCMKKLTCVDDMLIQYIKQYQAITSMGIKTAIEKS